MPDEIRYLAIVQRFGLTEDNAVVSRGFHEHLDAVRWVRNEVEEAELEAALVIPHFTKLTYDFGGQPTRLERWLWTVLCSGGPTWGMVIDANEITHDDQRTVEDVTA